MTRPDRFTLTPTDTAKRAHAKEPEQDGPDFRPGDLPESGPLTYWPGSHLRDPFYNPPSVRADERKSA